MNTVLLVLSEDLFAVDSSPFPLSAFFILQILSLTDSDPLIIFRVFPVLPTRNGGSLRLKEKRRAPWIRWRAHPNYYLKRPPTDKVRTNQRERNLRQR